MKKLIALAVLLLSAIILSSCGELPTASGPISLDQNEIKDIAGAVNKNNKEIGNYVIECYGKYDGVFICRIIEEGVEPDGIKASSLRNMYSIFPKIPHFRSLQTERSFRFMMLIMLKM